MLPLSRARMRIAAIDPGTQRVGYCFLERRGRRWRLVTIGTLRARAKSPHRRLREIQVGLEKLFDRHRPDEIAVERTFVGRHASSALRLSEGRGIVLAATARAGAVLYEYAAVEAKRAVTVSGGAAKSDVASSVQLLLGLDRAPGPDAADAAALALCHVGRRDGLR